MKWSVEKKLDCRDIKIKAKKILKVLINNSSMQDFGYLFAYFAYPFIIMTISCFRTFLMFN